MAGNARRPGATRRPGTKRGPRVGSGGERRQGLTGKGPTPKASERPGHPAQRRGATKRTAATRGSKDRPSVDLVFGRNAVLEALEAAMPAKRLLLQAGAPADRRIAAAIACAERLGVEVAEVPRLELDQRAQGVAHQGVALIASPFEYSDVHDLLERAAHPGGLLIALDGVTDPRNLGAIVRSAGAFGAGGVVIPARRAAGVTPVVWRASAGALARVPVAVVPNIVRLVERAQASGFVAVGLDARGDSALEDLSDDTRPTLLVVGGEGRGLGPLASRTCDLRACIPMAAGAESLNASVAASIAMYVIAGGRVAP